MLFWVWVALLVLTFGFGLYWAVKGEDVPFVWFAITLIVGGFAWLIVAGIATSTTENVVAESTKDLVTLNDAPFEEGRLSGAYVLIAGGVSGEQTSEFRYTWYERDADGGLRLRSEEADSEDMVIYEDAEKPYVEEMIEREDKHTASWAAPFNVGGDFSDEPRGWRLHVPPNTVVRDFELDAR